MFKFSAVELNTQCPEAAVPGRHIPSSTLKENRGTNNYPCLVASKLCVAAAKNVSPGFPQSGCRMHVDHTTVQTASR